MPIAIWVFSHWGMKQGRCGNNKMSRTTGLTLRLFHINVSLTSSFNWANTSLLRTSLAVCAVLCSLCSTKNSSPQRRYNHHITYLLLLRLRTTVLVVLDELNLTVLIDPMASDAMRRYSMRKSTGNGLTTSHDRVRSIHVLAYQTMQFCIRNPTNSFPRAYDDAMQSYCMRNLGLGNCLWEPVPFMKGTGQEMY